MIYLFESIGTEGGASMIYHENGLLPVIAFDNQHDWETLQLHCSPWLDKPGLERIRRAASKARTVAIERHYIDKDYRDAFSNYYSKRFNTPDARCIRLHFFSELFTGEDLTNAARIQSSYLGYSVIRPTKPNCVGRSMLSPNARAGTTGAICLCKESISIQGTELEVRGFPFTSQDAEVSVCAQASVWMLARYFSNRFSVYPEVYPHQVGMLTKDYSIGRLFPSSGLYVWQMAEALRRIGFFPVVYGRKQYKAQFERLL